MIQLPAGATASMPAQARDFGRGCRPGGTPGIQTRHSPGLGRCPGGTPSVAAVLGPAVSASGVGARMMVLVVRVQAATKTRVVKPRVVTQRRCTRTSRETVGGRITIAPLTPCRSRVSGGSKMWNRMTIGNFSDRARGSVCLRRGDGGLRSHRDDAGARGA